MPRSLNKIKALFNLCLLLGGIVWLGNRFEVMGQQPNAGDVVFSQIYTRGGSPGSTYKDNFVELFNRSSNAVDITGMPLHITTDTGQFAFGFSFVSSRGLLIPPGGYLLIQFETTGASGGPLPIPICLSRSLVGSASISHPPARSR